ncbi:uncharacterized protein LOC119027495 isoform X1 [Acanthopagrus latus]|uniref:uncharacterized protein LOC119027494 isoform X1 n=1 Tax=Acanthopagrus latus TaxID=8177 RepID=UPI00187BCC36|nr:uncharacterized protein LOC119027494 isoform X1 [Acanthopagrus latus]XP_036968638.1 uncharacterized protein LOC119027494 isoform X1 [Acanthopagrus latus]XP_036968639.1 uncharacterized protein LOC119027494 isoform X1 [Acanthopagrus latus]XP_036968641.1 uncharacterized protein LOC119027495 isoform X1 [Acanthopagrus latus]XP_036968642.1 uncharacterized protein LOC119027495 isoform X1 [Acanthopagrus latus]XP_036968643.1 uncharacterized protein LOC119027495 isoform X1 [Acanthopagrus latus]
MKSFTLIAALTLCSFSWISASVSQSQTVEAQSGEGVTLRCNNTHNNGAVIFWFRLVNRTEVSCVSVMIHSKEAKYCEGFQNGKFEMRSSNNIVSLRMHFVVKSDAGLYFCGFYTGGIITFSVTHLNVKGGNEPSGDEDSGDKRESGGIAMLTSVIVGALTFVLVLVIIGLVVKVRKLQTAATEENNPQQCENLLSDQLKDAAVRFYPTSVRSRRPASEREVETHIIYTASRQTQKVLSDLGHCPDRA